MTAFLGSFAVSVGLFAAFLSAALWGYAARSGSPHTQADRARLARQASILTVTAALLAVAVMEWALVTDNFALQYVAENSSRATPLLYRMTALWSALDGSLLLWILMLSAYGLALRPGAPLAGPAARHGARTCVAASVAQAVIFAFFVVTVFAVHPFAQLSPAAADGRGPNPLLADHPAMAVHPPLLYLGYTGLIVPFAYAIAALVTGRIADDWARKVRRWVLLAWVCLTCGIVLGAWWSYAVLGWGGYWAWDPVENASLIPWLFTTALVHSLLRRRLGASPMWIVTLATMSFVLVCTGTFLTRSGVVLSVHSFTQSSVGPILLVILLTLATAVAGLLIWRSDQLTGSAAAGGTGVQRGSARGTALLLNNVLLVGLAIAVLVGTFLPVLANVTGTDVSVGAPYYHRIAVPVGTFLLAVLVLGTVGRWRAEPVGDLFRRAGLPLAAGSVVIAALGLSGARGVVPVLALGLAAAILAAAGRDMLSVLRSAAKASHGPGGPIGRLGGHLAHAGLAVLAGAIAASSAWSASTQATVPIGGSVELGDTRVQLLRVDRQGGQDRMETVAVLQLLAPERAIRRASPALAYFPGWDQTVAVPDITSDWRGDLHLTLLGVAQDGSSATIRLAQEPLVAWLWIGGALMAAGGAAALASPRRKVAGTTVHARPGDCAQAPVGAAPVSGEEDRR